MKKPLVSVIIPTYKRAKMLYIALQTILSQTYENIEVIVVIDGPDKDSIRTIDRIKKRTNKQVRTVVNPKNLGLPASRNVGFDYAHGDLIFFSEDDLLLREDTIEVLVDTYFQFSSKVLKIGAIAPRVILISKTKAYTQGCESLPIVGSLNTLTGEHCFNYDIPSVEVFLAQHLPATSLIPKKVFNSIGAYYTGYKYNYLREESDLYLRMIKKGYILLYQPKAIAYHVSGFRGGCTIDNILLHGLADIHNHLIFLIRGYGVRAILMFGVYILNRILKVRYLNDPKKILQHMNVIEKAGFVRGVSIFKSKHLNTLYR